MVKTNLLDWELLLDGERLPCEAPCTYYQTLLDNGRIKDPFDRDNEKLMAAHYGDDCTFETTFVATEETLNKEYQVLVFEGLDTLCDVYLNGTLLQSTDNMHRTWRIPVKGKIRLGENTLTVEIRSAVTYFKEMHRLHPMSGNGDTIPGFAHVRKAFYMSGWDWGPTLPDMGIWRPAYLLAYDARIEDVEIRQKHEKGSVTVSCKTTLECKTEDGLETTVTLTDPDGALYMSESYRGVERFTVEDPKLWWPNGFGEQPLYTVTVTLSENGVELDRVEKKIGLRTITVSTDKDQWGSEFCFKVNGEKIFSMGANYIPEENFLSRRSREKTDYLLRTVKEANYNTVRVWGGGFYPDDWFYELCDQYGILVWQDFMFACNLVWLTAPMEATIREEAIENVKRIRHHASLALLCGNNENEEFMVAYLKGARMELEKADYLKLYWHILPDICAELAPDTYYWSSSPSSGTVFDNHADDNRGDRHIWTVWSGLKAIDLYKTYFTRFCSEFGFESMPDMETIEGFTDPADRNLFSEVMERHQKHKNGNGKLMFYMAQYYNYPTDMGKAVYATQLMQARAIRTAVEHFRRNRGRCMGSIFWQLNDCWPVASWSAIDHWGRPKAMFYESKRFFAPVLLSANVEEGRTTLHLVNEQRSTFKGTVNYRLKDVSFGVLKEWSVAVEAKPLTAQKIATIGAEELSAVSERNTFLEYELVAEDGRRLTRRTALFVKPKQFAFPRANIRCEVTRTGDGEFLLALSSDCLARKVKISLDGLAIGEISEQYFDLTDEEPIEIRLVTDDPEVTEKQVKDALRLLSESDLVLPESTQY